MSLQDELDALRAEFVRSAPPGRAALYDAKVGHGRCAPSPTDRAR
jgi:hypothetical protein